ncbi:peroxidase [Ranunculus cassubicifolius]
MGRTGSGLLILCFLTLFGSTLAQLKLRFYNKSCPKAEEIVLKYVKKHIPNAPSLAAALLKLNYVDCFVQGCDASILLNSTSKNNAERDYGVNLHLRGFGFIDGIKKLLEAKCPGIVSCADIIALAARDSIVTTGGPTWNVPTGRRDGTVSKFTEAKQYISQNNGYYGIIPTWIRNGLTIKDFIVLYGAHTIGIAHCGTFSNRLYNFAFEGDVDLDLDSEYADNLRKRKCKTPNDTMSIVEIDPGSSRTFDLSFYKNILKRRSLFNGDDVLRHDLWSTLFIRQLLDGELDFFKEFGKSMEKMGRIGVKTGSEGQIRKQCALVNT